MLLLEDREYADEEHDTLIGIVEKLFYRPQNLDGTREPRETFLLKGVITATAVRSVR